MFHLGLDIGGTKIEAVLLDSHGEIQLRERRPTRKESYQSFMDNLLFFINEIKNKTSGKFTLGIGLPGTIDPMSGLIKNCNCLVLEWPGFNRGFNSVFKTTGFSRK
ncbi:putative ROK family protein [Yersinia enterocolitica]|nr:putative ROK family protein [Yersinia enterocolitica]CNC75468.1 putative ROK family protein [Yersinia enterocolitica]CNC92580.1 putative ROK family protein [Yersinia enterocolitica]CND28917.1 putative ROK family protein [Yersinia enterocolitica]CND33752.1 putative ROK family protein [Yersinia enterocolitica]